MNKKLKIISFILTAILGIFMLSGFSYAANQSSGSKQAACNGLSQLGGVNCNSNSGKTVVGNVAQTAVSILAKIVGIVAVIMIIYAGFRYVTSGGESGNVSGAKNTLIYAIVGLVIVAISQLIVHYVLNSATGIGTNG